MKLRLAASEANLLKGCGLDFAHSVKRRPAAATDGLTRRRDKQLEHLPEIGGVVVGRTTIVQYDQFLAALTGVIGLGASIVARDGWPG